MRGPNKSIVGKARQLRRSSTDAEMKLWFALRDRRLGGHKFVRQKPVAPYIADFICRDRKLIIEVDGGQRSDNPHDIRRDAFLAANGYQILRFWNTDVLTNLDGVLTTILAALEPHKV
jgi:very-short-patch-repair endonuclease